jgi:hypothetical protein
MIELNEANINQAMLRTYEHLKRYKDEGWKTGKAFALVDGWKNVYHLTRGSEEMVLEFDLRKTISFDPDQDGSSLDAGDRILLTMMSCGLATDAAEDVVKEIKKRESPSRGCMALLLLPGSILAAGLLTRYFFV